MSSTSTTDANQTSRDFYDVLGVSRDADSFEIKQAYRNLAKQYHPDTNPGEAGMNELFQEINLAYHVLSNPELRRQIDNVYDAQQGRPWGRSAMYNGADGPYAGSGSGATQQQKIDIRNVIDSFFGGENGFANGAAQGPLVGEDVRFEHDLDFRKAVFGGEDTVEFDHMETCGTCAGSGVHPGSLISNCGFCGGTGLTRQMVRSPFGEFETDAACPTCHGTGNYIEEYCEDCHGRGVRRETKKIQINVPRGAVDGKKIRVRGEGDAGPNGGPAGDLYVIFKVKEDPVFRRIGTEIYSDATISYVDAILGTKAKCPVIDGEVMVDVEPGTQPGDVLKLEGIGAPEPGADTLDDAVRGDLFLTIQVEIPNDLPLEEQELIEKVSSFREKKSGEKAFTPGEGAPDVDFYDKLRRYILECPYVPSEHEAIKAALAAIGVEEKEEEEMSVPEEPVAEEESRPVDPRPTAPYYPTPEYLEKQRLLEQERLERAKPPPVVTKDGKVLQQWDGSTTYVPRDGPAYIGTAPPFAGLRNPNGPERAASSFPSDEPDVKSPDRTIAPDHRDPSWQGRRTP